MARTQDTCWRQRRTRSFVDTLAPIRRVGASGGTYRVCGNRDLSGDRPDRKSCGVSQTHMKTTAGQIERGSTETRTRGSGQRLQVAAVAHSQGQPRQKPPSST
jgi:hypothetical protein